jgi:hypothetical protein
MAAAVECYQRCVDITPAMAKYVIEVSSQQLALGLCGIRIHVDRVWRHMLLAGCTAGFLTMVAVSWHCLCCQQNRQHWHAK